MLESFIIKQGLNQLFINIICLLLILISIKITRIQKLFMNIIYLCIFSLLLCSLYIFLDGPDVAMTEASLGAALTTVIFLSVLKAVNNDKIAIKKTNNITTNKNSKRSNIKPITICIIVFFIFIFGFADIADFGNEYSILSKGVSDYYIKNTKEEIGIDSFVAAILASYRGFDTLYETCVIFLAGIAALLILGQNNNYDKK
jgi:multicomponent Na+:H+ antiporter subunit B